MIYIVRAEWVCFELLTSLQPGPGRELRRLLHVCKGTTRQFLLRGLNNARGEWSLVTMAWNVKRMFALKAA
jgi:hypothetical protein